MVRRPDLEEGVTPLAGLNQTVLNLAVDIGVRVGGKKTSEHDQVWSLTQFYSVDFSKSRIGVKKCVFNKRTIKVSVSC